MLYPAPALCSALLVHFDVADFGSEVRWNAWQRVQGCTPTTTFARAWLVIVAPATSRARPAACRLRNGVFGQGDTVCSVSFEQERPQVTTHTFSGPQVAAHCLRPVSRGPRVSDLVTPTLPHPAALHTAFGESGGQLRASDYGLTPERDSLGVHS